MGGVVDGTCHGTGLLAGGCGSMRSCIFLIFMPADFTPCIFAFLITEVLMDKVSGGPLDVMALVLRCFTTTGECFCSEDWKVLAWFLSVRHQACGNPRATTVRWRTSGRTAPPATIELTFR